MSEITIRVAQMPRDVRCAPNNKKNQLGVTWKSVDSYSYQNKDEPVRVVLHSDDWEYDVMSNITGRNVPLAW